MIPDPILAILSIVGLFTYAAIGGVVSGLITPHISDKSRVREYAANGINADIAPGFWFIGLLWPVALVVALVFAVVCVPTIFGGKICRYLTKAQIERK